MLNTNQDNILDDFDLPESKQISETSASLFGRNTGIVSFLVGTILLLLGILRPMADGVYVFGFFFLIAAFFFNLIIFIILLFYGKSSEEKYVNRRMAVKMLLNIPIAMLYFFIIVRVA